MSFLRNLVSDLVEKRLWPVAILLVGALVAVPFALGGTSAADPAETATATPSTTTTTATTIRVSEDTNLSSLAPTGAKHNPFTQPEVEKAATPEDSAATTPSASEATPTSGDTGSTGGGATTPSTTTTTPSGSTGTTKPETDSSDDEQDEGSTKAIRVDLRFGEPGNTKQRSYTDIARLSALPSAEKPIVIFLGVKKDKKTATFLIPSDATATGDGACKPSATNCQTIEMQEGDSTFLDIDLGTGVRQFRLDVQRVGEIDKATTEKASTARARASVAGRAYLRSALESGEVALSGLDFSERTGTLTSTPRATTAGPVGRGAYRVDVKVGRTERRNVSRLQVLPQRSRAKILFLGVREGGRSVSFLNLQHKRVTGASCKPSPTDCERITLRRGRVAQVGGVRVKVTRLKLRNLASETVAQAARTREDETGRAIVGARDLDLTDLALNPLTGALVPAPL
jgi:hypothetical protein